MNVEFEEEKNMARRVGPSIASKRESPLVVFLMKRNLASTDKDARRMLVVFGASLLVASIAVSALLISGASVPRSGSGLSPETLNELRSYAEKNGIPFKR